MDSVIENSSEKISGKRKLEDSDEEYETKPKNPRRAVHRLCPYLDTINRHVLDFDFEKLCSISLSRINVYACLVCGKYFQGRGTNTHAYLHSVGESHHVFLNLHTLKFYCLPDNYEIIDSSLDDIKYVLNPTFTQEQIDALDVSDKLSRAIDGTMYLPGIVGLNNIKANDYCNVILQRFGELMRKLWNPRNFKAHVSPHEMLQAVVLWSRKKFQFTEQGNIFLKALEGDPIEFLSWFLNALHLALNGSKKPKSSVVYRTLLGSMRIYTRKIPPIELEERQREALLTTQEYAEVSTESPFLYLTCDLPPPPLFKDEFRENIIPQVNLYTLLTKFNAQSEKEYKTYKENFMKRFEITKLPPYLILYIKRFTKNTFFVEKNPTIVNFPIKNVDFGDILTPEIKAKHVYTNYDLVANIVHDGEPGKGTYRVHVLHKGTGQWYEMQDLHVTDILPQMITLTEAYIQIYELKTDLKKSEPSG
ncbi:hypothetical protein J437_LFUL006004 [Ladona fulva]|uniref:ubiquitinyl hydrolase 1 n=1 Tax=Ladona fulva TaxID=123851 RepID=A0A8K0JZ35_LADFU|nr:hypothetical protein J437_LFUL006004 [Ladona fulva]